MSLLRRRCGGFVALLVGSATLLPAPLMAEVPAPPWDFDIVGVSVNPSSVAPGSSTVLTVYIKNTGDELGTVKAFTGVKKGSGPAGYPPPNTLFDIPVGETRSTSWTYTPSQGEGQYWVTFDVQNPPETHQFDTTGFVHSLSVTTQRDPTASRASPPTPVFLQVGESQTFVANLSDSDCDLNYAEWYVTGSPTPVVDNSLAPCTDTTSWTHAFTVPGTFDVTVVVFDDRNDGSHVGRATWSVEVGTGDPPPPPPLGECYKRPDGSLRFSGYDWNVKAGWKGPGHRDNGNLWDPDNVWCDAQGRLHLEMRYRAGTWTCAEIWTQREDFGFGRYEFKAHGDLDNLDRHVVLGFFNYPPAGDPLRPDGTNEIDIEFSRWGDLTPTPTKEPGVYGVYPYEDELANQKAEQSFIFEQNGPTATTHRFFWQSTGVRFESFEGGRQFGYWPYEPEDYLLRIPQRPLPVHINLWLFRGTPPSNGLNHEIVVESFTWTPDGTPTSARAFQPLPLPVG